MPIPRKSHGREVMVRFTCSRCGVKELASYDDVMREESWGNLHMSTLPNGWDNIGYSSIVCQDCAEAFKKFMNP